MEVIKDDGIVPNANAGGVSKEENKESVSYDSFKKVLDQRKSDQEKLRSAQSKVEEFEIRMRDIENDKLAAEGKKDELIERYKGQLGEKENEVNKLKSTFGLSVLNKAIEAEAQRKGCTDPSKLMKLIDPADLKGLEIKDDFSISGESLESLVDKAQKENSFLFKTNKVIIKDEMPSNEIRTVKEDKPKTSDGLIAAYKRKHGIKN